MSVKVKTASFEISGPNADEVIKVLDALKVHEDFDNLQQQDPHIHIQTMIEEFAVCPDCQTQIPILDNQTQFTCPQCQCEFEI